MTGMSKIATAALLATLICGCARDRVRSPAEFAEAQEVAKSYDVNYIHFVEANAEAQAMKVIWVHPPYGKVRFNYTLPIKLPQQQKPLNPETKPAND